MINTSSQSKGKYLLKNIGLLTISSFGSKILIFLLIPLYTSVLTTEEYGIYDLYTTTIQLITPILTLNIADSVMRFCMDKEYSITTVVTVGVKQCIIAFFSFTGMVFVNNVFNFIPIFSQYAIEFILLFISGIAYSFLSQLSRGIEKVKSLAISGIINTVFLLILNILFLLVLNLKLNGYFYAYILSNTISSIYLIVATKTYKYLGKTDEYKTKKDMYSFSKPLILNHLAWWVNGVSDRYIVTWLCGIATNGIYSVAYKIPSVLNTFQTIFCQAWTISAIKEYGNNESEFYAKIYKSYNCGMTMLSSLLIVFDKPIAKILFANEFYSAWKYAPFLTESILFGALSGFLGGIFSAAKNSKVLAKTTLIGASVNTILNFLLVKALGPIGAAIATLISYVIVWATRLIEANKIVSLNVNLLRDIISYIIITTQALVLNLLLDTHIEIIIQCSLFVFVFFLYISEFRLLMGMKN